MKGQVVQQGVDIQVEAVDGMVELQFRLPDDPGFALVADRGHVPHMWWFDKLLGLVGSIP